MTEKNTTNSGEGTRISALEHELDETRNTLHTAIAKVETANREMISTNDELQTANEELQSLNDELHTLNEEDQQKIKELKKKAEDLMSNCYEKLKITSNRLKDINSELERSNMDLLQFASVASHDLKEPLRKIQTFANSMYEKMKGRFDDEEISYMVKIIKSSDRMQLLIEDVLTLSKLSNQKLSFSTVDLNSVVSNIKDDIQTSIKEKNAEIITSHLPQVKGVHGQLHQLFQNLISNALKFTDKDRPVVEIKQKLVPETIAAALAIQADDFICVSVKDNGIGFEPQFKEKIFGVFQRLNAADYEGTGIGLAICRKIMENHNGYLTAESKLSEGCELLILFPKS